MLCVSKLSWPPSHGQADLPADSSVQWVLGFGGRSLISAPSVYASLRQRFPAAQIMLSSTAGEISGTTVLDDSITITAISFQRTAIKGTSLNLRDMSSRHEAGAEIGRRLRADDLALVFVLSDGQNVNGSELVAGLNTAMGGKVPVVGGLAGDGASFDETVVGLNSTPEQGVVAAVGLYGDKLEVKFGSEGGWEPFGPERIITKSQGNILLELDNKPALELYRSYLGDRSAELPGSGLLFPLSIQTDIDAPVAVRTLLGIDEAADSITFAGDMPVGATVRLMRASYDNLIQGARHAALACQRGATVPPQLAILISCVGRKAVLNQRVEEEVESVAEVLDGAEICGFYSYGELSPTESSGYCELHNQTMTITTISER